MKKILLIILLIIIISPLIVEAKENDKEYAPIISILRAGGGGSGGGGSSSGGGSATHGSTFSKNNGFISNAISLIIFGIVCLFTSIVFYYKILRSSINSKRYLKLLGKKDITWKYKNIERRAIDTYYSVQESWTNMDMTPSREYMAKDLYDSFNMKLNFMKINNKRNILKFIKLINIKPISIYDDEDDNKDHIWFYIKGCMVDYIVDTNNNEILEGKKYPATFVEFWRFTRTSKNKWVLSKIKQRSEMDTINFQ